MSRTRLYAIRLGLASVCALSACTGGARGDDALNIGAAASTRVVLPALAARFEDIAGVKVRVSYAASGTVARQCERGAPLDLVIMASAEFMRQLEQQDLIEAATTRSLATNRIVVVGRRGQARVGLADLGNPRPGLRIAIGDPRTVPAGLYARRMLEDLGHWQHLRRHLVLARDVTAVLAYTERGEVDAGVVYATDLTGIDEIEVFDRVPVTLGVRPQLLAALTGQNPARSATAARFLDFLVSEDARRSFAAAGFGPPGTRS